MINEEDAFINATYHHLNSRHNNIYQFVMKYNDYIISQHDYGTGIYVSMTEAHTLTYIEDNPGTTITELAQHWSKTKSALSQTVSKLVDKGLVYRHKTETNAKTVLLYVTEDGRKLSKEHKLYDTITISKTLEDISKHCTAEEIDAFYKVIGIFAKLL